MSGTAFCELCRREVPLEELMAHLHGEHDLDVEVETWPDGAAVVLDSTLEPEDFA